MEKNAKVSSYGQHKVNPLGCPCRVCKPRRPISGIFEDILPEQEFPLVVVEMGDFVVMVWIFKAR